MRGLNQGFGIIAYRKHGSICLAWLLMLSAVFAAFDPGRSVQAEEVFAPLSYQDIDFGFGEEELLTPPGDAPALLQMEDPEPQTDNAAGLPRIYDPRQRPESLVSLKDQNPYGCCWAFSALGACEASVVAKGISTNTVDLSERHLAYYFYKKGGETGDSLGGTLGDYNANGTTSSYLDIGGNNLLTIWHLASWCGPVAEETAPYAGLIGNKKADETGLLGMTNSTQMAYENDVVHLQNAYVVDIGKSYEDESQRNTVKELILKYGALTMSYYADKSSTYDNAQHNCYYYDGTYKYKTNHAVQVVGWDDTFPKEYFNEGHRPDGDGAWLIKNSWGEENGTLAQNGYFWLSYYDYALRYERGYTQKLVYVYDCERADNYDHIYQYDGDAGHKRFGKEETQIVGGISNKVEKTQKVTSAGNIFTASANGENREILRAVGIGVSTAGAAYTLSVYTDVESSDPESGTLVHTQQGSIPFNGYHTILLEKEITLSAGQRYSVVFSFDESVYVYASRNFSLSPWQFFSANTEGLSFVRTGEGAQWIDCARSDALHDACAMRIKAYTDDVEKPRLSADQLTFGAAGETAVLTASVSDNTLLRWECSDPQVVSLTPMAADGSVSENGTTVCVTALADGFATVTVCTPDGEASCSVLVDTQPENENVYINMDTGADGRGEETPGLVSIQMSNEALSLREGQSHELTASAYYSDGGRYPTDLTWRSSDETVAVVDQNGCVTALQEGTTTVTARSGDISAQCIVTVTAPEQETDAGQDKDTGGDSDAPEKKPPEPAELLSLTMHCREACVAAGKTLELCAEPVYSKENATDWMVYWKSSDPTVAEVNDCGVVSAKKPGKALITVYNGEVQDSCTVTVLPGKQTFASAKLRNGKIELSLKKQSGVDGYVVYRGTSENGTYKAVKTLKGAKNVSYTGKALKGKKLCYYKARAYKLIDGKKIYGAYSRIVSAKPAQTTLVKAKAIGNKYVKITWKKASRASGYVIYRSTRKNSGYKKVGICSNQQLAFVDRKVKSGRTYYYKVRACRTVSGVKIYGAYSDVKSVCIR